MFFFSRAAVTETFIGKCVDFRVERDLCSSGLAGPGILHISNQKEYNQSDGHFLLMINQKQNGNYKNNKVIFMYDKKSINNTHIFGIYFLKSHYDKSTMEIQLQNLR